MASLGLVLDAASYMLDLRAWSKDIDQAIARVESLLAQPGVAPGLEAATEELVVLQRTPVAGYRRTRRLRGLLKP